MALMSGSASDIYAIRFLRMSKSKNYVRNRTFLIFDCTKMRAVAAADCQNCRYLSAISQRQRHNGKNHAALWSETQDRLMMMWTAEAAMRRKLSI